MLLRKSNFEIPARFSFQPFPAEWRSLRAETVGWVENPLKLKPFFASADNDPEKNWVQVRIEVPTNDVGMTMLIKQSLGAYPFYEVLMNRTSIPPDVLPPRENDRNTLDIAGRSFGVLICSKARNPDDEWWLGSREFLQGRVLSSRTSRFIREEFSDLEKLVEKNAWIMHNEFLNLEAHPKSGWDWSVQQFLNKWGLWRSGRGYEINRDLYGISQLAMLARLGTNRKPDPPDFVMIVPHFLRAEQERYRKAILPRNARQWLNLHPLNLSPGREFPFFRVRTSYCADAIEAIITIDHLAKRKQGICKRCHRVFQRETKHEKNYCSKRCYNAACVQRWRENQRKKAKKGTKHNAKG